MEQVPLERGAIGSTSGLFFLLCKRKINFERKNFEIIVFLNNDLVSIKCTEILLERATTRWNLSA